MDSPDDAAGLPGGGPPTTPIDDEVFKHLVGLWNAQGPGTIDNMLDAHARLPPDARLLRRPRWEPEPVETFAQVGFKQTVTAADGRPLLKLKTLPARGDPIPPVKVTVLGTFATTGRHLFQRAADNVTEPNLTAEVARAAFGSAPYAKNVAFTDINFYAHLARNAEVWNTLSAIELSKRGRERARALGSRVFLNTAGSNKEQWGLQHADALETATNLSANLGVMAVLIKSDGKDELHIFAPHLSALTRWRGTKATLQNLPKTIEYLKAVVRVFDALDAANPLLLQRPLPDTTESRFWPLMHEQLNQVE
ncbi:hypothetical protein OC834_004078 [Tilletia horrida]|nr:hypothetical protein OC834_004078 [Tilletia horrida]